MLEFQFPFLIHASSEAFTSEILSSILEIRDVIIVVEQEIHIFVSKSSNENVDSAPI